MILKSVQSQDNCDETFLNSISKEFLINFLSLFSGESKYLLYVMNKVVSEIIIPKNPSIKIGELGKSYTGTSMGFSKLSLILINKIYAFLPFATIITGINK